MTADERIGIALVAHDRLKTELADWAADHRETLGRCRLYATGTTGGVLMTRCPDLAIERLESGPLGGDLQIGALLVEGRVDMLVFFVDPLTPQPHDVDVKALIRIATLYGAPLACNRATADALIASPWLTDRLADPASRPARQVSPLAEAHRSRAIDVTGGATPRPAGEPS